MLLVIICNNIYTYRYIEEEDLLRFLMYEEVYTVFPMFGGSESGKISKSSFRNWVVRANLITHMYVLI